AAKPGGHVVSGIERRHLNRRRNDRVRGRRARRHGEREVCRGARRDVERRARATSGPGRGCRQGIARACLVDAQVREGRDARHGGDARRSGQDATARIRADRHGHGTGEARRGVPLRVARRYLYRRCDRLRGRDVRRFDRGPGLAPRATVTLPVKVGSVFPEPSWAVTCTAGVIDVPAAVLLGCTENTKCAPMPAVILNVALGLPVSPVAAAVSVYPVPTLSTDSPENVATPLAAATVVVPESVPPPGFALSATVTVPVNPVAVFPCASCAVTCTAGVIAVPAVVLLGWTLNTSWLTVPDVTLNAALVAGLTPLAAPVSV